MNQIQLKITRAENGFICNRVATTSGKSEEVWIAKTPAELAHTIVTTMVTKQLDVQLTPADNDELESLLAELE